MLTGTGLAGKFDEPWSNAVGHRLPEAILIQAICGSGRHEGRSQRNRSDRKPPQSISVDVGGFVDGRLRDSEHGNLSCRNRHRAGHRSPTPSSDGDSAWLWYRSAPLVNLSWFPPRVSCAAVGSRLTAPATAQAVDRVGLGCWFRARRGVACFGPAGAGVAARRHGDHERSDQSIIRE